MRWVWRNIAISTVIALGIFYFIAYTETNTWPSLTEKWPDLLVAEILVFAGISLISLILKKLNIILPWHSSRAVRFLFTILSGLMVFFLLSICFTFFYLKSKTDTINFTSFWSENWEVAAKLGIIALVLMLTFALVDFWMFTYNQFTAGKISLIKLESNQKKLQFQALQSQLSPHFLFNSLNTISSLLYKDIKITEDFIHKLTQLYQYVLKTENRNLVTLREETSAVNAYFFMEKIKYGDSVELSIEIAPNLFNTYIPPLTLQMLVENVLKHNFINPDKVLKTEIFNEDEEFIVVRNNIIAKPELLKIGNNLLDRPDKRISFTIGLNNISDRYSFFTHKNIEIKISQWYSVRLPVIMQNHGK